MLILSGSEFAPKKVVEYLQKLGEDVRYFPSVDIPEYELEKAEMVILFGEGPDEKSPRCERIKSLIGEGRLLTVGSIHDIISDSVSHHIEEHRKRVTSLKLFNTVKSCTNGLHIFVHDNPDPDALASAMALEVICREAGVESKAYYGGEIGYTENEIFLECTGFSIDKITADDITSILQEEADIAFVDFARPGENNKLPKGTDAKLIIDHHYTNKDVTGGDYVEVKSVGATSTLMTEHLRRLDLPVTSLLASALIYGIKVDTMDYTRNIGHRDFEAIEYLITRGDSEMLTTLDSVPMDPDTMDALARAISNRNVKHRVMTTFAEDVKQRDDIPRIADILEGERDISTVLVMGIFQDTIHMSARSKDPRLNLGEIMNELYEDIGSAGGHQHSAGGNVSLTEFKNREEAVKDISTKFIEGVKK